MNLRSHKQVRQALQAGRIAQRKARAEEAERLHAEAAHDFYDDDYEDYDDNWSCTHCGGGGYCQVDDPLWDDCDEFGYGPCKYCSGTGERRHQTVF